MLYLYYCSICEELYKDIQDAIDCCLEIINKRDYDSLLSPLIINNGDYCGYKGIRIEGTKTPHPRGHHYELVIVLKNGDIVFGYEQGNYAGGISLKPDDEGYADKRNKELSRIKKDDVQFYNFINYYLKTYE